MGPRPRGRGISYRTLPRIAPHLASMGPRPRGRGIAKASSIKSPRCRLQWGRDRAVAESALPQLAARLLLFASMGPRPRGRGIGELLGQSIPSSALQWGRDRAVAESGLTSARRFGESTLQWGRDRAVAESPLAASKRLARSLNRFNGAATARSRNLGVEVRN